MLWPIKHRCHLSPLAPQWPRASGPCSVNRLPFVRCDHPSGSLCPGPVCLSPQRCFPQAVCLSFRAHGRGPDGSAWNSGWGGDDLGQPGSQATLRPADQATDFGPCPALSRPRGSLSRGVRPRAGWQLGRIPGFSFQTCALPWLWQPPLEPGGPGRTWRASLTPAAGQAGGARPAMLPRASVHSHGLAQWHHTPGPKCSHPPRAGGCQDHGH